ncbi:MAG: L,D-transpeptidase family protein [Bacteriovoracaceae bacterium]|nr:L,D-transpeptidase family protein [Bacteriovoracaceae bacterium]
MHWLRVFFILILVSGMVLPLRVDLIHASDDFLPMPLLYLDNFFSHHLLIAEKATHKLYLFKNSDSNPHLIKTYQMATGKKSGNKLFQGDYRTPEGIYQLTNFITKKQLIKRYGKEGEIYGIGSFVMDYPNPIDRKRGKTGGGIWLHSTNDETRIDKGLDSRGCIVIANNDLKDVSRYIELNKTMIVIVHELNFLNKKSWDRNRKIINDFVINWADAWKNENLDKYLGHYHETEFSDHFRGSFKQFKIYKRSVFNNPGLPDINLKNVSIIQTKNYATVTFLQEYKSRTINDIGKKILYLKKDDYYNWKIVSERWSKTGMAMSKGLPDNQDDRSIAGRREQQSTGQVAFRPSMRFFDNEEKNIGKN